MELFDKAEKAVVKDSELMRHVELARMSLYFAGVKLGYGSGAERYICWRNFTSLA